MNLNTRNSIEVGALHKMLLLTVLLSIHASLAGKLFLNHHQIILKENQKPKIKNLQQLIKGSLPAAPENITVTFLNPTSVRVSWQTTINSHISPVDKFDVIYKPTDAR